MKPKPIPDPHPAFLAVSPLDWTRGPLAQGLACYHSGQFFLAHEHWEAVWLTLRQPEKDFLQGLIQITAAFHHLQRLTATAPDAIAAPLISLSGDGTTS